MVCRRSVCVARVYRLVCLAHRQWMSRIGQRGAGWLEQHCEVRFRRYGHDRERSRTVHVSGAAMNQPCTECGLLVPEQSVASEHDPKCSHAHGRRPTPVGQRHPVCLCGAKGLRDDRHDAYYCPSSGVWLESPCDDQECQMCQGRPEKRES